MFDGDTLLIDMMGRPDTIWIDGLGAPHTDQLFLR